MPKSRKAKFSLNGLLASGDNTGVESEEKAAKSGYGNNIQ
jgi:hypothetical protein